MPAPQYGADDPRRCSGNSVSEVLDKFRKNYDRIMSLPQETKCEIPAGGSLVEYVDDMREKLEAAEKRIAELEAREISLPERSSMLHRTDFHEDYQTVMAYKASEVIDAIRATGIRIKGE